MVRQRIESPVLRYLQQLELAVKQKVGVAPEAVLMETCELLIKELESLHAEIDEEATYQHFLVTFGTPDDVAQRYEDAAKPSLLKLGGVAPNWRISCGKCGRSAPAAKVGITRIGARSKHKYVLGWCHDCGWLRWMRLTRDLEETNLTAEMMGIE